MTLIPDCVEMTERFARDIIGLPIPDSPTRLGAERKVWAEGALAEELGEFSDAETLEDEADALLDLMYFAGGRLVEMGLPVGAAFEEVHQANMRKERGELSKRPFSKGFDAIKPAGWTAPDLMPYCTLRRQDIEVLSFMVQCQEVVFDDPLPKILVIGHKRHGKDTVGELLRDEFDMAFTSSSAFCAETVVMPAIEEAWARWEDPVRGRNVSQPPIPRYASAQECFDDRGIDAHRKFWYDAIRAFNQSDPTALGAAIFAENDIYVGLRHKAEFHAVKNAGIPDVVIWVDRSEHLPPESPDSCTVEPWMADFVVDNNGSIEDLKRNLMSLMSAIVGEYHAD